MAHNPPRKLGDCAMLRPCKDAARRLYEITQSQQGFFTTKQAIRGVRGDDTRLPRSSQKLDSRAAWNLPAFGCWAGGEGGCRCKKSLPTPSSTLSRESAILQTAANVASIFGDRTSSLFGVTAKNLAILAAFSSESRLETRPRSHFSVLQSN